MKLTIFALFCLAVTLTHAWSPAPKCYKKTTKCCYRFSSCGVTERKVTKHVQCSYRKCEKKCSDKCENVYATSYKKKCGYVTIPAEYEWCHKGKHEYCGPQHKYQCKKVPVESKVPSCTKHCYDDCRKVSAVCEKIYVYQYTKYCATLSCSRGIIEGSSDKPADIISDNGKLVDVLDGKRKERSTHKW